MTETKTAMDAVSIQYQQDTMFRRYVDTAVHEAMRHMEHVRSEVDRRDLYHVAVTAAMTAIRLTVEGDRMLTDMEFQRDHYRKLAEQSLRFSPVSVTLPVGSIDTK